MQELDKLIELVREHRNEEARDMLGASPPLAKACADLFSALVSKSSGDLEWRASLILPVRNVCKAAEYYRDILGFALDPVDGVFQPEASEPGGVYAIVKRAGVWLHFQIRRDDLPARTRLAFERDIYLYVSDLDGLYADLTKRGALVVQPPHMASYGIREMVVEDLNGYRLAFGELVER